MRMKLKKSLTVLLSLMMIISCAFTTMADLVSVKEVTLADRMEIVETVDTVTAGILSAEAPLGILVEEVLEDADVSTDTLTENGESPLLGETATIDYINRSWNDTDKKVKEELTSHEATKIENSDTKVTLDEGWYYVDGTCTISGTCTVTGTVNIILKDDAKLTVTEGIVVPVSNSLFIYGQDKDTGLVSASSSGGDAGIGGGINSVSGSIEICGGSVTVESTGGAGIGSGVNRAGGSVAIYGGTVTATSMSGAGIGAGNNGAGGNVAIYGGTVIATSTSGAGIGGGSSKAGGIVTIYGGTVTATSTNGAGIGAGKGNTAHGDFSIDSNYKVAITAGAAAPGEPTNAESYAKNRNKYVHIEPMMHTVTFDSKGGSSVDSQTVTDNSKAAEPSPAPTKAGFDFAGWYKDTDCTDGQEYDFDTPVIKDITLYAKWTEQKTIDEILPDDFPTQKETGWENENGKKAYLGTDSQGTETIIAGSFMIGRSAVLTSSETGYEYTGNWDGEEITISFTVNKGTLQSITVSGATTESRKSSNGTYVPISNYTVTFDTNGGSAVEPQTVKQGGRVQKPAANPTKSGYTFAGWYADAALKDSYDFAMAVERDLTIFAKWNQNADPTPSRDDDHEPLYTGTWNAPVKSGSWSQDANGIWHYTSSETFRNTWGYIVNPYAKEGQHTADWFWFDRQGNMLTGWQFIGGKWYYLNPTKDGTLGACQLGGVTPDGWTVKENGEWDESIPKK